MGTIAIVGGGASGLACAIAAKKANPKARVLVFERLERVGKKILSTGNGRCNFTNREISPQYYKSRDMESLSNILADLPTDFVPDFFSQLGLMSTEEEKGRIYPYSFQASSVMDVLLLALNRLGVELKCSCEITRLSYEKACFTLFTNSGETFTADRLVLSSGGLASGVRLGCDGQGFRLAKFFGHSLEKLYPCLVPFRCNMENLGGLKGIRSQGVLSLYSGEKLLGCEEGEIQFTEYGLSGIPAMDLSNLMVDEKSPYELHIDLFPRLEVSELQSLFKSRAKDYGNLSLEMLFTGLINKRLGFAVLKSLGISPLSRPCSSLSSQEISRLGETLKAWRFPVSGTLGWDKAQVSGGGVPLEEIEPNTMESRRRSGLFLTGEMLDVVGNCGGYNLHWAWSSGILAGRAAAKF
ncbi:MAG: aminoacetone oxidase family FAD-binding enzyme [Clostridiales bacterium]|nr:aminoacetone oxidase family FAD-binding enzyme [Clostridiales bacterium]